MKNIKDLEMPAKAAPESEEEFDFGFEDEAPAEGESKLASFSDEELMDEMKKRGFAVEDMAEEESMAEEMPEEEMA